MAATSAWQRYQKALESKNYEGSSGYWGGPPVPGANPGDAGRRSVAAMSGLSPSGAALPNRYAPGGSGGIATQLKPYEIVKNQRLNTLVGGLYGDVAKGGADIPGFEDYLKQFSASTGGINAAFDSQAKSFDLEPFFKTQRDADAAASGLTDRYAGTTRGLVDAAGASTARYGATGEADLNRVLANASDTTNFDRSIADALALVGGNMNRNQIGTGTGASSGNARYGAGAAVRATLPLRLQQQRDVTDVLGRYLPFHGDVASREDANIRLGLGNEGNIYGQQQGDVLRGKATEANIQDLKIKVAGLGVDAAIRKLLTAGQSVAQMQAVLGLPAALITQKLQAAGLLGALDESANWRGVEYPPGANVADPAYFNNTLPNNYPGAPQIPNRYGGGGLGGTGGVRYDLQSSDPAAYFSSLPKWAQDQRRGVGAPVVPAGYYPLNAPNYRNTGTGTGYILGGEPVPPAYTGQEWSDRDY